jgi:hypothetical protein
MLRNTSAYILNSVSFQPGVAFAFRFYSFLLDQPPRALNSFGWNQAVWPLLLALIVIVLAKAQRRDVSDVPRDPLSPRHEIVALVGFVLLPFAGQLLAVTVTHSFIDRYALPAVIGFSCLVPLIAASVTAQSRRTALALSIIFSGWFVISFGIWFARLFEHPPHELPALRLATIPKDAPIVISDPLLFLEVNHREPPEVAARLRFLTERSSALRYTGTDLFDRGYYTMERWFPIKGKIAEFTDFIDANKRFFVYGPFFHPEDWLIRRLTSSGLEIRLLGQYTGRVEMVLLEIKVPESATETTLNGDQRRALSRTAGSRLQPPAIEDEVTP